MGSETEKVVHLSARADEVEASSKAIRRLANPNTFPQVLALVALALLAAGAYFFLQSQTGDRAAFVSALDRNTAALTELTKAVQQHELAATVREQIVRDRAR
jgi:uncharacterized protein HemX